MTTPTIRNPTRLLCDQCRRPFWINELSVHDGQALCNECAGPAGVQTLARVAVEPSAAQQEWGEKRQALQARFEGAWDAALSGIERPLGVLQLRMAELLSSPDFVNQGDAWRMALGEVSPVALACWDVYRAGLKELGQRPTDGKLRRVEEIVTPQPTATAHRVEAYWCGN